MRSAPFLELPVLALCALAMGCPAQGSQPAPGPNPEPGPTEPPPPASTTDQLDALTVELCACKDSACRQAVDERFNAFVQANQQKLEAEDRAPLLAIRDRYTQCKSGALLQEFSAITEKMCACADTACTERVNGEFEAWMNANQDAQGSGAMREQAMKIAERYTGCLAKAMGNTPTTLPAMGQKCGPSDACADGLECVKYFGIAGPRGGEFTSCEKRCGKGKPACGDGLRCTTIADGPGQVCRAAK